MSGSIIFLFYVFPGSYKMPHVIFGSNNREVTGTLDMILLSSMKRRGFPKEWIRWVRRCITIHVFSVLVNGHLYGG